MGKFLKDCTEEELEERAARKAAKNDDAAAEAQKYRMASACDMIVEGLRVPFALATFDYLGNVHPSGYVLPGGERVDAAAAYRYAYAIYAERVRLENLVTIDRRQLDINGEDYYTQN